MEIIQFKGGIKSEIKPLIQWDDKEIEGDELGIFLYGMLYSTVVILFAFSNDPQILKIMTLYLWFDVAALIYMGIFMAVIRKTDLTKERSFLELKALGRKDVLKAVFLIGVFFMLLLILNGVLNMFALGSYDILEYNPRSMIILQVCRTIIVEEMVFRGALLTLIWLGCSRFFKLGDSISIILAVGVSSGIFGAYHVFAYSNQGLNVILPIIYLSFLGLFCALLKLKYGLWAAISLHMVNNLVAVFSGSFLHFEFMLDSSMFYASGLILFGFISSFICIKTLRDYFKIIPFFGALIISFILGFVTNGLIREEDMGMYFEHFHAICFLPFLYFIKSVKIRSVISISVGTMIGLFISDYEDILHLSFLHWYLTIGYLLFSLLIFSFVLNVKSMKNGGKNNV